MKGLKKTFTAMVTAALACVLPGQLTFAQGTQDKLDSANSAIRDLRQEQKNISSEITDLNEQAEAAGERINDINNDINSTRDDIAGVNEEIAVIEDDMSVRYDDMKLRIQYIYESGDLGLTDTIIGSGEIGELLNKAEYIQRIYDYDRNELEVMASLFDERESKKGELEAKAAQLDSLKSDAESEARSLEAMLIDKRDELKLSDDKLAQLEELAKKYEKQLEEERLAREEAERKAKEEAERRAKEEAERRAREEAKQEAERKAAEDAGKAQEAEAARQAAAAPAATAAPATQAPTAARATEAPKKQDSGSSGNSGSPAGSNAAAVNYSNNDLDMLAAIIEVEAGDQIYEGRLAVGSVVMNRVASPQFPNSISGVIYQSGQFSPVASGRFAACLARGAAPTNVQAAKDVLGGVRNVPYLFFRMHYGKTSFSYSSYTIIQDHVLYNY